LWISDGLRGGSVASRRPRYPESWQRLETLGFPCRTEPRVLALSAYAYQRGVSLLLAYIGADGATPVPERPPAWAEWDGSSFWGPVGATEILAPQSTVCVGVVCNGNPAGACLPYQAIVAPYYPAFAPAGKIETPTTAACAASCVVVK
jgi:hypothetical protein